MQDTINNCKFRKKERLSSEKDIECLFEKGKAFLAFPLRVIFYWEEADEGQAVPDVAILISVGKKKFKHAVDRNRLKRLVREAYRLNKHLLADNPLLLTKRLRLSFVYIHKEKLGFNEIEKSMKKALETINQDAR